MDKEKILLRTADFVYHELKDEPSGHDWWHIYRVTRTAKKIAEREKADVFICEMAALLHDIADEKLNPTEAEGIEKVRNWLLSLQVDAQTIAKIIEIISTMSFKDGRQPSLKTLEGKIVQDADRLDAIGAIGIARTFAFAGSTNQLIYDPNMDPKDHLTFKEYQKRKTTAIHHFYEKLLKVKSLMNTEYGKKIAKRRHAFMEEYLELFFDEWEGKN